MKYILIFLVISVTVRAYEVEKVKRIEGPVRQIEFDRYNNTYVTVGPDRSYSLYKLDNENNIIFSLQLPMVGKFLMRNDEGDIYFINKIDPRIYFLKSNSTEVQLLLRYDETNSNVDGFSFLDQDGNLYVNHANGVTILKPGQNFLTAITNLNGVTFHGLGEDSDGNVYLRNVDHGVIFVITKEAKKLPVPYAEIVSDFGNGLAEIQYGYEDEIFATYENPLSSLDVRKLTGKSSELLYSTYKATYTTSFHSHHRFFLVGQNQITGENYVHIFTPDGQVVQSQNVFDNTTFFPKEQQLEYDNDDNLYLVTANDSGWNILWIEKDDTEVKYLNFTTEERIWYTAVDDDANLWILSNRLHVYSKNTGEVTQVSDLSFSVPEDSVDLLKYKGSGEIFIGAFDGLYICK